MAKQIKTQYVVMHKGRAKRLTLVEETNGIVLGRFENVRDVNRAPASAYTIDRFAAKILVSLANCEPLTDETRGLFGLEPIVRQTPDHGETERYGEHAEAANIVYKGHEKDGMLGALESHEEDMILIALARSRRLYGEYVDLSMLLRSRH